MLKWAGGSGGSGRVDLTTRLSSFKIIFLSKAPLQFGKTSNYY